MRKYTKKSTEVSRTLDSSSRTSRQAIQRRFAYEAGDKDKNTALKRQLTESHPLAKEIEDAAKICKVKYSLAGPFAAEKGRDEECNAEINIPGEDAALSEVEQKAHNISTLHELTHVKAIFENEFDLAPLVYHTVYEGEAFHGREIIPLEEALTVGLVDEGTKKHSLHTIDTFKPLSTLSDEEWGRFAPLQKDRYQRVYGAASMLGATENNFRTAEKRIYYAPERKNLDEAWQGMETDGNTSVVNIGYHGELKKKQDELKDMKKTLDENAEIEYKVLSDAFETADEEDFFLAGDVKDQFLKYDETSFMALMHSFHGDYEQICKYFSVLVPGGIIEQWSAFKNDYSTFKQKYGSLISILRSYKSSVSPGAFSLFGND